jgi:hypothetical protein
MIQVVDKDLFIGIDKNQLLFATLSMAASPSSMRFRSLQPIGVFAESIC